MNEPAPAENNPKDHGQIVRRKRLRISWAWVFPILAALATAWLFWSDWRSNGPEIEISFDAAPGMQAGKTPLLYRGVTAGIVRTVRLDKDLERVILVIRLKAFATDLARAGTTFWIDQPVVGLAETTGLDALIQGNSVEARAGDPNGAPTFSFEGVGRAPLTPLESPALVLKLRAASIPFLDRGSPLFYRGIAVGVVEDKALDEKGLPYLRVVVEKEYAETVRKNARFWPVSATSIRIGAGGVKLDLMGLKSILLGSVEFDIFGPPGETVGDEEEFKLYPDRFTARATGDPVHIFFRSGQSILPGQTEVRHLGMPVGLVESTTLDPDTQTIDTVVRFQPEFDYLHSAGTTFTVIRPKLSLEGISGLETIVTGVYIDCVPGIPGPIAHSFQGNTTTDGQMLDAEAESQGLKITLHAKTLPPLGDGAPVLYRGIVAGRIVGKSLDSSGQPALDIVIRKDFASAVLTNSRFWLLSPLSAKIGPGVLNLDVASVESLVQGGIAFDTFGAPEAPTASGANFQLYPTEAGARATSPAIRVSFENGQGLLAGQTQVRHLGQPVGLVESVTTENGKVETVLRLNPGYDFLRRAGSSYSIVRFNISLKGVTGMETIVSGVYIEVIPSESGKLTDRFTGVSSDKADFKAEEKHGLEVVVTTPGTQIGVDAPVTFRGLPVGRVGRKVLASDGRSVGLVLIIDRRYAPLIRTNTQFWDAGGLRISLAFISIKVQTTSLDALTRTGVAFATPTDFGPRAQHGTEFPLAKSPRREWLQWSPAIPTEQ